MTAAPLAGCHPSASFQDQVPYVLFSLYGSKVKKYPRKNRGNEKEKKHQKTYMVIYGAYTGHIRVIYGAYTGKKVHIRAYTGIYG